MESPCVPNNTSLISAVAWFGVKVFFFTLYSVPEWHLDVARCTWASWSCFLHLKTSDLTWKKYSFESWDHLCQVCGVLSGVCVIWEMVSREPGCVGQGDPMGHLRIAGGLK